MKKNLPDSNALKSLYFHKNEVFLSLISELSSPTYLIKNWSSESAKKSSIGYDGLIYTSQLNFILSNIKFPISAKKIVTLEQKTFWIIIILLNLKQILQWEARENIRELLRKAFTVLGWIQSGVFHISKTKNRGVIDVRLGWLHDKICLFASCWPYG